MLKTTTRMMMGMVMNMSTPVPRWAMQYLKLAHIKHSNYFFHFAMVLGYWYWWLILVLLLVLLVFDVSIVIGVIGV